MSLERVVVDLVYLLSAALFISGLRGLGKLKSAPRGHVLLAVAMLLAVVATIVEIGAGEYSQVLLGVGGGAVLGAALGFAGKLGSLRPVALATAAGGGAAALFALSAAWGPGVEQGAGTSLAALFTAQGHLGAIAAIALVLAIILGAAALVGGLVAAARGGGQSAELPGRTALWTLFALGAAALVVFTAFQAESPDALRTGLLASLGLGAVMGAVLALPLGARDLPAGVSALNACSGLATAALGYLLVNNGLLLLGGLVFAASIVLSSLLSEGMSRSLSSLFFGGESRTTVDTGGLEYANVRSCGVQEAAMVLEDAHSVVIVPGFGYAVAQAQHATRELVALLEKKGAQVRYAVHPMAGRMPGHMNVLLSEADVPYTALHELDQINDEFKSTEVVLVLGGNDIVNPDAAERRDSPVYGLPVMRVNEARTVFVVKRSLRPGYSKAKNPLFESANTMMLFGDAKKVLQTIATELKGSSMGHG